jgi:hypothetical protein
MSVLLEFIQYFLPTLGVLVLSTFAVGLILSIAAHIDRHRVD